MCYCQCSTCSIPMQAPCLPPPPFFFFFSAKAKEAEIEMQRLADKHALSDAAITAMARHGEFVSTALLSCSWGRAHDGCGCGGGE